jgi:hypothetical protein
MLDETLLYDGIVVELKNNFGIDRYYPSCALSKLFCSLSGTKTLTPDMLTTISKNGLKINAKTPSLAWPSS